MSNCIRYGRRLLMLGAAFALASCNPKDGLFFEPELADVGNLPDIDAPVITFTIPLSSVSGPLNIDGASASIIDPNGTNGAPPSGVDPSSVGVLVDGASVGATQSGSSWNVDFADRPDGQLTLRYSASDLFGNSSDEETSFFLKRTGPLVELTETPPATLTSSDMSLDLTMSGTITDDYLGMTFGGFFWPGVDEMCATPDDELVEQGNGAGQISLNGLGYGLTAPGGPFSLTGTLYNWVPEGGQPETRTLCAAGVAYDMAGDGLGGLKANETRWGWSFDLTFEYQPTTGAIGGTVTLDGSPLAGVTVSAGAQSMQTAADGTYLFTGLAPGSYTVAVSNLPTDVVCDPDSQNANVVVGEETTVDFACVEEDNFAIQLNGTYRHFVGFSRICVVIATSPAQPGASYTATATGPGVNGSGVHNGTLDASGEAVVTNDISLYGSYQWNVGIGTISQSVNISVTGAAGTCTF